MVKACVVSKVSAYSIDGASKDVDGCVFEEGKILELGFLYQPGGDSKV
jgi:hypothetical protein